MGDGRLGVINLTRLEIRGHTFWKVEDWGLCGRWEIGTPVSPPS